MTVSKVENKGKINVARWLSSVLPLLIGFDSKTS
ncbi:MAG: hypothetical protein ACJAYJ_003640 [Saprospiraceae bacterium]|jgi:hypothetical protein